MFKRIKEEFPFLKGDAHCVCLLFVALVLCMCAPDNKLHYHLTITTAIQPISDQCGDYHSTPATVANHEMGRLTKLPITKSRHTAPG